MNDYERASRGGFTPHYPETPGFKARQTAKDAAAGITPAAGSLRARVLEAIRAKPSTPEEVAATLGVPLMNVRPRASELATTGLIVDSGQRRTADGGRQAIVWKVKDG